MRLLVALALVACGLLAAPVSDARAQSSPRKYLTTASTNSNLVKTGRTQLRVVVPINTTTTIYYLKLYNKATAPTCGTDTPLWTIPVPFGATNSGSGMALATEGLMFPLGLGICVVGGIADNDNSNAAAGLVINLGVTGY